MNESVSAFAARKVQKRVVSSDNDLSTEPREPDTADVLDRLWALSARKRRRKNEKWQKNLQIDETAASRGLSRKATDDTQRQAPLIDKPSEDIEESEPPSEADEVSTSDVVVNKQLSTFVPSPANVLIDNEREWSVKLGRHDVSQCMKSTKLSVVLIDIKTIALIGQYDLWVKKGAVSIYGAVIYASSKLHRVYAPTTHAIPIVRALFDPFGPEKQTCELSFRSCSSGIRRLGHLCPQFKNIWNVESPTQTQDGVKVAGRRSFSFNSSSSEDSLGRPISALQVPPDWIDLLTQVNADLGQSRSKTHLICGPKGSGKSTLCRLLLNSLHSAFHQQNSTRKRALYLIDLDPGQPEFHPPGQISLTRVRGFNFGVPFTHPSIQGSVAGSVIHSHFLGALSPRDDPEHYLRCVEHLFHKRRQFCQSDSADTVINCPGWIQGTGLEILLRLITVSRADRAVYTSNAGPQESIDALSIECKRTHTVLQQLSSPCSQQITRSASELRNMHTMSYFHLTEPSNGNDVWDSRILTRGETIKVHFAGPQRILFAVAIFGDEQNAELLPDILVGSVVGLVVLNQDANLASRRGNDPLLSNQQECDEYLHHEEGTNMIQAFDAPAEEQEPFAESQYAFLPQCSSDGIPFIAPIHRITRTPPPKSSSCIGQALIHSIDLKAQCFHITTPVAPTDLKHGFDNGKKMIFVRGNLDTPAWAYREDFEYMQSRAAKQRLSHRDDDLQIEHDFDSDSQHEDDDLKRWVEDQPWLSVSEAGSKRAKARKIRKDIRYKPRAENI